MNFFTSVTEQTSFRKFPRKTIVFISIIITASAIITGIHLMNRVRAQSPTPITSCGTVTGSVILQSNLASTNDDCLRVGANNVTINGNGKTVTVTGSGHAVFNYLKSGLTVRNLNSNSDVYINGDSSDSVTVANSDLAAVNDFYGDNITVKDSTLDTISFVGTGSAGDPNNVDHVVLTNNTIRSAANKVVIFTAGDASPCPSTADVITNNTMISDHVCGAAGQPTCDEPMVVFLQCTADIIFSNNTVQATGLAQGIRIRDETDNSTFTNNNIWVADPNGDFGGINITSGNSGKHHPQNNVWQNNFVRSNNDLALNLQSPGPGNVFENNIFWTNTSGTANLMNDGSNGNIFKHNTFFNAGSSPALFFDYPNNRTADTFSSNIVAAAEQSALAVGQWSFARYTGDRNLFWSTSSSTVFSPQGSLASWQSAANPDDANSVYGNPRFVNVYTGDFHLQASSAAIGVGEGGTDAGAFPYQAASCTEDWSCGPWSPCVNSLQSRSCVDVNNCGTTASQPALTQSCVSPCIENWTCTAWSACSNDQQTRTCTDTNSCGTTVSQPPASQSCSAADATPPSSILNLQAL
ncbi:MAG: hypothetical protein HY420_04475 [Candidatus Kerfeldbacteria bacterium]|nr:hypothetical protein [Candidatus Kerfeldbacteria bacterium]